MVSASFRRSLVVISNEQLRWKEFVFWLLQVYNIYFMNLTINCEPLVLYAIRQNIRRFESLECEAGRFDLNLPPV